MIKLITVSLSLRRSLQLLVVLYVTLYQLWYAQGYQEFSTVESSTTTKVVKPLWNLNIILPQKIPRIMTFELLVIRIILNSLNIKEFAFKLDKKKLLKNILPGCMNCWWWIIRNLFRLFVRMSDQYWADWWNTKHNILLPWLENFQIINFDSCHQVKGYSVSSLGELTDTLPPHLQVLNTVLIIAFFPGVIIEQLQWEIPMEPDNLSNGKTSCHYYLLDTY